MQTPADRFLLWIDAVGGYWVCQGDTITIGQPNPQGTVDVPVLGDIASCHVRLHRKGEGVLLEALHEARVDGRLVRDFEWLRDRSEIQLGGSVRLSFRRPHVLSGTARLDFLSRHRTQPSTDAVLWMAGACILGPKIQSHVVCRNWPHEVILFRDGDELFCQSHSKLAIDGHVSQDRGRLARNSRVRGEGLSFNIERIS